jgi:drug/metabolite transporter (DMT)-like permease
LSLGVFLAVLGAAMLHAAWNAAIKGGADRFASVLALTLASGTLSALLLPFVPAPAPASWMWIAASALLHFANKMLLIRAYALADLSQVYPLARGTAPMVVALVSASLLGEPLTLLDFAAVAAIGCGVMLMSLRGGADLGRMDHNALGWALATAAATAGYTIVDGIGARLAGTASGYILWMFVGDAVLLTLYAAISRGIGASLPCLRSTWLMGLTAGAMSLGSYWVAVWAFTKAPIALVAALRETSVLFAMLIAVTLLGERATRWRWIAAASILGGVILMRVA